MKTLCTLCCNLAIMLWLSKQLTELEQLIFDLSFSKLYKHKNAKVLQLKSSQTFIYLQQNNSIVSPFTNYVLLTQLIMEIKLLREL